MLSWDDFLKKVADKHGLFDGDERKAFLAKFAQESLDESKSDAQVANSLSISEVTLQRRLGNIYEVFSLSCPYLNSNKKGKFQILRDWLKREQVNYQEPSTPIDWRDICNQVLATQQLRRQATAQQYELNIYVPLGLMERPKTPNPRRNATGEDSQPQKEPELQIVQTYKDDAFFQKVIAENHTEKGKHIAIIGEPGAGKTTLLGEIAQQLHEKSSDFPICIRLADLQDREIKDYLLNNWLEKALEYIHPVPQNITPEITEALKQLFRQGKVWLLLDGVDEMAATSPVQALAKIREQLTDWVGKARVVLTCRLNVWDAAISNTLTNFDTYKTLEFEPDDVDEFIRQWFEEASQEEKRRNSSNETFWREQGKRLQQQLKSPGKERIKELVRNPLRLSMLCQSWCVLEQELPETKAALYEQFTTYFFEWKQEEFQKKQRVLNQRDKKQIQQALAKLALAAMESTNRFRIEQDFAIEQMEEVWFNLADELGWLVLVDRDTRTKKPVYSFLHFSFQEYFAALAIDKNVNYWDFFLPHNHINLPVTGKRYRIFESQWKEVILLWLGRKEKLLSEHQKNFINALVKFDDGIEPPFYRYRALFLAAAGIAEFRDLSWANQIIQNVAILSFGILDKEQEIWRLPLEPLAQIAKYTLLETERAITIEILLDFIVQCKQYQPQKVYFQVLAVLKEIGNENYNVINFLENQLYQSNIPSVRGMIAEVLGSISRGNVTAIRTITEILEASSDLFSIEILSNKLELIGENNFLCINVLEKLLEDCSKSKEFKRIVGTTLWHINNGNQKAFSVLIELVKDNDYPDKFRIFEVISKIINSLKSQKVISTLIGMIRNQEDKDEFTKILALKVLLLIPNITEDVFDDFVKLVRVTTNNYIHYEAIKIINLLADVNNKKTTQSLKEFCSYPNDYLRYISASSLCELGKNKAIAINTLEDIISNARNEQLRCDAAYCLAQHNKVSRLALETLEEFVKVHHDDNIRKLAATYLIKVFPSNYVAIEALQELATNCENELIRRIAAINLGYYQTKNSIAIKSLLCLSKNSKEEFIRGIATESLGDLGLITNLKSTVIDFLIELLKSNKSSVVCKNAADALKKIVTSEQKSVIVALKNYISEQTYINDFGRFYYCYDTVWHYAQNLPYPNFYQAWHQDTLTNTATANLNIANLPQNLAEAINNQPELCCKVKLICIDTHQIIDPENPAPEIYDQMLNQNCPEWQKEYPETMQKLKLYWNYLRRISENPLFFICYDSTALSATPTGFSETFLKALSKFDGAICVVWETGEIGLQTFSPSQPNLIADIVGWMREKMMKNL